MHRALKAVAVVFALLVAAALVMFIMGAGLPREHTATATVTIHAPQGRVWSLMEDVEAQPLWRTGLKSVKELPNDADGHRCWLEVQRGMRMPLCESTQDAPITRVVAMADSTNGFGGSWTYDLTSVTPDVTSVTIVEQGTVDSPVWRFAGHYLYHEDTFIRRYEADLKRVAEHAR